ncbi:MAG: alternative ribosome rescue aminoacyl-tRNA hydrolase ArfB [Thermodesulfobacteriota bacterium]|nr:alternative ribosome rescue aminoacyl-tRNA hydrolase ArfB [Thermodesulfobacteriota bacterium]
MNIHRHGHCSITPSVCIPLSEVSFTFSRSSGSGGQHVNKVNSRATLWFDIGASQSLTADQKQLIRQRLAGRINKQGMLRLDADRRRSQGANREDAVSRFASLLRDALHVDKKRRKTKPSRGAKQRRLQAKKHRSRLKKQRGRKSYSDE